jgi:hypothetical protein
VHQSTQDEPKKALPQRFRRTNRHAVIGLTQATRVPATHLDEHRFVHEQVKLRTV